MWLIAGLAASELWRRALILIGLYLDVWVVGLVKFRSRLETWEQP